MGVLGVVLVGALAGGGYAALLLSVNVSESISASLQNGLVRRPPSRHFHTFSTRRLHSLQIDRVKCRQPNWKDSTMILNQPSYEVDWQLGDDADSFDDPQEAIETSGLSTSGGQPRVGSRRRPMAERAAAVTEHRRPALVPSSAHDVDVGP